MFYSVEVLGRKGRFGLVWLMVTQREKAKSRRKEILLYNVAEAVEELLKALPGTAKDGRRKFSLYLSAQLTLGLARLLHRKAEILAIDAQAFVSGLHRPIRVIDKPNRSKYVDPGHQNLTHINETDSTDPEFRQPQPQLDFLTGLQQPTDEIFASTTNDDTSNDHFQPLFDRHQAHLDEITLREPPQPIDDQFHPDQEFPPMNQEEMAAFLEDLEAAHPSRTIHGRNGQPQCLSDPDAPPRSLTPPNPFADQTEVPVQDTNSQPPLPSIGLDLDVIPAPPKRRRVQLEHRPMRPLQGQSHPSISLSASQVKAGIQDYADIHLNNEGERIKRTKLDEPASMEQMRKIFFTSEGYRPLFVQLGSVRVAPQLMDLWRDAGGEAQRNETPRTLADVNRENPYVIQPLDISSHSELAGAVQDLVQNEFLNDGLVEDAQVNVEPLNYYQPRVEEDEVQVGRDEEQSLLHQRGRPSSRLAADHSSILFREGSDVLLEIPPVVGSLNQRLADLANEEGLVELGRLWSVSTSRAQAARDFAGLLRLIKIKGAKARQSYPFAPIRVTLLPL